MGFQSTLAFDQGFGRVGSLAADGPLRAQPGVTKGTAANIVVGRAFTIDTADGQFAPGGTNPFGGILLDSHELQSVGTSAGGPLAPTMTIPAGTVGSFCTMGTITVALINACNPEDGVYFVQADGTLGAGTAGAGQTQILGAKVKGTTNAAAGLARISLTGA